MKGGLRSEIRRRLGPPELRDLLLDLLSQGVRMKRTRSGLQVFGPDQIVQIHFTSSDHRSAKNATAELRRAGLLKEE